MNRKSVPENQLRMREAARHKPGRGSLEGLQPDQVARLTQSRRQKKSKHTIFRSIGSPAKHVRRLHPRRGE